MDRVERALTLAEAFRKRIEALRLALAKVDHLKNRNNYVRIIDLEEDRDGRENT